MTFSERLAAVVAELQRRHRASTGKEPTEHGGLSSSELERRWKIPGGYLSRLTPKERTGKGKTTDEAVATRKDPRLSTVMKIVEGSGCSLEFLTAGRGPMFLNRNVDWRNEELAFVVRRKSGRWNPRTVEYARVLDQWWEVTRDLDEWTEMLLEFEISHGLRGQARGELPAPSSKPHSSSRRR